MDPESARRFAQEWIAAWNAHDIENILRHYADDVEFTSPFARLMHNPSGTVRGKEELRAYFSKAVQSYPELHFEFIKVFTSVNSVALHYRSVLNLVAVEVMEFDKNGKVRRVLAHYTN